jgi:hypothetical protein
MGRKAAMSANWQTGGPMVNEAGKGSKDSARAQRFHIETPIRFRGPGELEWQEGRTENISRSGILFWAGKPVEPGTPVELDFQLPGEIEIGARVLCHGEIVRTVLAPSSDAQPGMAARILAYRFERQDGEPKA